MTERVYLRFNEDLAIVLPADRMSTGGAWHRPTGRG